MDQFCYTRHQVVVWSSTEMHDGAHCPVSGSRNSMHTCNKVTRIKETKLVQIRVQYTSRTRWRTIPSGPLARVRAPLTRGQQPHEQSTHPFQKLIKIKGTKKCNYV